ncbi:hypothetical protein EAI_13359, partial [Harpegnathos saltator]
WESHILRSVNPIRQQQYSLEVFSDASMTGWGTACNGETTCGTWNEFERKSHINYLELKGAFYALKCFANNKHNCEILLRIDNTTAISYINRIGGIRFQKLTEITKEIWQWYEKRKIW